MLPSPKSNKTGSEKSHKRCQSVLMVARGMGLSSSLLWNLGICNSSGRSQSLTVCVAAAVESHATDAGGSCAVLKSVFLLPDHPLRLRAVLHASPIGVLVRPRHSIIDKLALQVLLSMPLIRLSELNTIGCSFGTMCGVIGPGVPLSSYRGTGAHAGSNSRWSPLCGSGHWRGRGACRESAWHSRHCAGRPVPCSGSFQAHEVRCQAHPCHSMLVSPALLQWFFVFQQICFTEPAAPNCWEVPTALRYQSTPMHGPCGPSSSNTHLCTRVFLRQLARPGYHA